MVFRRGGGVGGRPWQGAGLCSLCLPRPLGLRHALCSLCIIDERRQAGLQRDCAHTRVREMRVKRGGVHLAHAHPPPSPQLPNTPLLLLKKYIITPLCLTATSRPFHLQLFVNTAPSSARGTERGAGPRVLDECREMGQNKAEEGRVKCLQWL